VDMRDYDRSRFEDATGCIPLLLDKCVVDGKIDLNVQDVRDICAKAVHFVVQVRKQTNDAFSWNRYV